MESEILTAFLPSNTVFEEHHDIITSMMRTDPGAFLQVSREWRLCEHVLVTNFLAARLQLLVISRVNTYLHIPEDV